MIQHTEEKTGSWIGIPRGYGKIERVVPEYFEGWEGKLLDQMPGRKRGELIRKIALVRKLCNLRFKTRSNISRLSVPCDYIETVGKREMESILSLLNDERVRKKYEALSPATSPIGSLVNIKQWYPSAKVDKILAHHNNDEVFDLHMEEALNYLQQRYGIDILNPGKSGSGSELWLQFNNKEFAMKNKKRIYSGISVVT